MIAVLRGLFSRPTTQPDVPSPLDRKDGWGWGGGLTPGARAWLYDRGYSKHTIDLIDADVRAMSANR